MSTKKEWLIQKIDRELENFKNNDNACFSDISNVHVFLKNSEFDDLLIDGLLNKGNLLENLLISLQMDVEYAELFKRSLYEIIIEYPKSGVDFVGNN